MAGLPANQGKTIDPNSVDLAEGTVAYEAFTTSLSAGNNVQQAVAAANSAAADFYNQLSAADKQSSTQAVWTPIGDSNVCPMCKPK
jgi:hypothetical protein